MYGKLVCIEVGGKGPDPPCEGQVVAPRQMEAHSPPWQVLTMAIIFFRRWLPGGAKLFPPSFCCTLNILDCFGVFNAKKRSNI